MNGTLAFQPGGMYPASLYLAEAGDDGELGLVHREQRLRADDSSPHHKQDDDCCERFHLSLYSATGTI